MIQLEFTEADIRILIAGLAELPAKQSLNMILHLQNKLTEHKKLITTNGLQKHNPS